MRTIKAAALLGAVALVGAGCGSSDSGKSSSKKSQSSSMVSAPGAQVAFVTPKSGAKVGQPVTVKVRLTGFMIAPKDVGKKARAGRGHLHFSLDGGKYDYPRYSGANGKLAEKLGVAGKYSPSVAPAIAYRNLPKGRHKLEVYLANNDHSNTGVEGATSFTVR